MPVVTEPILGLRHTVARLYIPSAMSTARFQARALSFAPDPNQDDCSRWLDLAAG